jgi:hypothetical protein
METTVLRVRFDVLAAVTVRIVAFWNSNISDEHTFSIFRAVE